jgi:hypothetical protein
MQQHNRYGSKEERDLITRAIQEFESCKKLIIICCAVVIITGFVYFNWL